jgi:hypothetical protein
LHFCGKNKTLAIQAQKKPDFLRAFDETSNAWDCGYSLWSEPLVTQLYSCMGIGEHVGVEAWGHGGVVVWPNPASGVLSVKVLGLPARTAVQAGWSAGSSKLVISRIN